MTDVKLPRVLNADMTERARLHPASLSISLNLTPISTASMTLPPGESVAVHDWVELYTATGSAGIYRAASVRRTYTGTTTVELEHGLCALGDGIIMGEGKYTGTAAEITGQMLAHQVATAGGAALFAVGAVAGGSTEYSYDHTNILSALKELVEGLGDYAITCDQTALPWRVGIAALSTTPSCEGRLARNLTGVQVTYDDADLCTRIVCPQLDGDSKAVDGPTIGQYGVIVKTITATQNAVQDSLRAYITKYLEDHKHPTVAIELSAVDLSTITGEPLDHFTPGALCRIALPDYGVALNERVIGLDYSGVYDDPASVRVKLSSSLRDTRKNIATLENDVNGTTSSSRARGSGGSARYGGGSGITPAKLIDQLFAEDYVIDPYGEGTGESHFASRIELNAQGVRLSAIDEHIDTIGGRLSTAEASITINAQNIELKVSKDGVISSINQTAEAIQISASRIDLSGYVTASSLSAQLATLKNGMAKEMYIGKLSCGSFQIGANGVSYGRKKVVTSVGLKKELMPIKVNGVTYNPIGGATISYKTDEIYYLSWE